MTDAFSILPAPPGYLLITITDDDGDPIIENRLSAPVIVLGFVVRNQGGYFGVLPMTAFDVYGESQEYALIRPDGKVEISGMRGDHVFESINDWKQFMRREAAELYTEVAEDMAKKGDKKGAAQMRSAARAHQKQIDENY